MEIIDDDGRLFGLVNIVDALVVLLVLAVLVAGAALVLQPEEPEPEPNLATTHVTLDLGTQPTYIVSAINEGDGHSAGENSQLTITDVHLTPQEGNTRVIVRAELQGLASGGSVEYGGAPPRLGRSLTIATSRYEVSGSIRDVGQNDTLARETTTVVLRDTMAPAVAEDVTAGDEVRVGGRTVATVQDVAAYATDDPTQRAVFVEATLDTHRQQGERRFGGTPVQRGQTVALPRGDYTLSGTIERVDGGLERDSADVLLTDTVDVETANRIAAGDVATVAGHDTAEVASVTTYATNNPDRKRVFVGVTLQTLAYGEREQFGTAPVQRGTSLTVDTDAYELSGPIERVGTLEQRGSLATRTVTLRLTEVRQDFADAITVGMTERSNGETIARVTDVRVEPSLIIATGDNGSVNVVDHPFERDVTITTEMQVRETTNGVQFKGQTIRQGSRVVVDLGTITIQAPVVSIGP